MKYSYVAAMMSKQAYGGDLVGDGSSYYDRADFYSIDPEWDEPSVLADKRRYNDTVTSMQEYANSIRNAAKNYDIDGVPVTNIVLSKQKYNESDNMEGLEWADKVDAAISAADFPAIYDLASYGYAWYGTDKGKNLNPNRKLRMDSKGRIIQQEGNDKGALIGLGVVGGVGLLAALACYGRKQGWFGQSKKSSVKQADFSLQIVDEDFEGATTTQDKYKKLNAMLANVANGKNTSGWQHGPNKGKLTGLFVGDSKSVQPYSAWKDKMDAAIAAGNMDAADKLLRIKSYYGVTDDPKNTYDDIISNATFTESLPMSDKALNVLYAGNPKLQRILEIAAQHRDLVKQQDIASNAQADVLSKSTDAYFALEQEKAKALKDLDSKVNSAFGALYDAQSNKLPEAEIAKLRELYTNAQKEYDIAANPFDEKMIAANRREMETLKPYRDALEDIYSKLDSINRTKL